jgi:hypothetical protein
MSDKEINELLNTDEEILFLKKKSEISFLSYVFSNLKGINFLYLLFVREKYDYLIMTHKRVFLLKKNKLVRSLTFKNGEKVIYNAIVPELKIFDKENNIKRLGLNFMRITYEENQEIKRKVKMIFKNEN